MTLTIDDRLLAEAQNALQARTKAETVRLALQEALRRKRLFDALSHRGQVNLDLDQEKLKELRQHS
ncbi:MAG: type II toxin-antitoxin system VapB family antitoxin [Acidobacteriota bacterium]